MPAEARRVHACLHADAEETELRDAESGARAVDEWNRGHDVHSWARLQCAGAVDCADSRRPRERSAGSALSRNSGNTGCSGRREPEAGQIEVRSEETKVTRRLSLAGVILSGAKDLVFSRGQKQIPHR